MNNLNPDSADNSHARNFEDKGFMDGLGRAQDFELLLNRSEMLEPVKVEEEE